MSNKRSEFPRSLAPQKRVKVNQVPVVADGRLVGLLSRESIIRYLQVRRSLEEFILDELGRGPLEDLVKHGPCEEQRRGSVVLKKERSMGMTVRSRFIISILSVRESSPA